MARKQAPKTETTEANPEPATPKRRARAQSADAAPAKPARKPAAPPSEEAPAKRARAAKAAPASEPAAEPKAARRRSRAAAPEADPEPPEPSRAEPAGDAPASPAPRRGRRRPDPAPDQESGTGATAPKGRARSNESRVAEELGTTLTFRKRTPRAPEPTDARDEPAMEEPASKPARRRPSRKGEPQPEPGTAAVQWRTKDEPEAAAPEPSQTRNTRRRRRDDARPTAEIPEPARPAERPGRTQRAEPEAPSRRSVAIPADAPQIVDNFGVPALVIRHRAVPPICLYAITPDEHRLETVLDEVKLAHRRGVRLVSLGIELFLEEGGVDQAVVEAGFLLKQIAAISPDIHILYRLMFRAPEGWERTFKDASFVTEEGGLAEPSVCDDGFWGGAEESLRAFVRKLLKLDTGGQVVGVHLDRGEWFYAESDGYDTSVAAQKSFREWLRHRYRDDVTSLRAAWFEGSAQFETVAVPEFRELSRGSKDFVRTDRKARAWVDFHLFLSDATCDRLARLAYAAKEASQGRLLVGVSYGYTFEWSHPASGHLALGKLLRAPEIDYIAGPPSYRNREPGKTGMFPGPVDSFPLNNKLYISEEDFKTSIGGVREPDDYNPAFRTPQALESAQWRGAGAALAHASGLCWMDRWGSGWLELPGIWQRAEAVSRALTLRLAVPQAAPDVAVLVDERSLAYLLDAHAFQVLVQDVNEALLRSGLSVGFYLLSDLGHRESFPDSRLYVFVNAWDIRPEVRSAIKGRLQRDGKLLFWLYAAGLFEGGRESLERVREVTGIALRPQPFNYGLGTTLLNLRDPLAAALPAEELANGGQLEPSYFAIPEGGRVLGEYTQTGLPSFVQATFPSDRARSWSSVFLGEPVVTPAFFRALAQEAGAHVWSFQDDVIHVRPPFLTVHCSGTGQRTIALPEKFAAYSLTADAWQTTDGNNLRFNGQDGQTHVFLVAGEAEIERLLELDPEEVLKVDEIDPRQENTLHWNELRFDVPIMKLDEWVEETWSDDLAEDFLIKPSMFEPAGPDDGPPSEEEFSVSRGGRRGRRRRKPSPARSNAFEGDDTMHVLFRKRE